MELCSHRQRDALDRARDACAAGDYPEALAAYEYFFEHALDDDPYALYGVRLSYCLAEWERLGRKYPKALERLVVAKDSALCQLEQTRDPERFHDFVAICHYLECSDQPIQQFLAYHSSDPELAGSIVRFIWDELVKAAKWEECGVYLGDPQAKYATIVMSFDQAMDVSKSDPTLGGTDLIQQIERRFVRDVSNLLLVLKNTGRKNEAESIRERVARDMLNRESAKLTGQIVG